MLCYVKIPKNSLVGGYEGSTHRIFSAQDVASESSMLFRSLVRRTLCCTQDCDGLQDDIACAIAVAIICNQEIFWNIGVRELDWVLCVLDDECLVHLPLILGVYGITSKLNFAC